MNTTVESSAREAYFKWGANFYPSRSARMYNSERLCHNSLFLLFFLLLFGGFSAAGALVVPTPAAE